MCYLNSSAAPVVYSLLISHASKLSHISNSPPGSTAESTQSLETGYISVWCSLWWEKPDLIPSSKELCIPAVLGYRLRTRQYARHWHCVWWLQPSSGSPFFKCAACVKNAPDQVGITSMCFLCESVGAQGCWSPHVPQTSSHHQPAKCVSQSTTLVRGSAQLCMYGKYVFRCPPHWIAGLGHAATSAVSWQTTACHTSNLVSPTQTKQPRFSAQSSLPLVPVLVYTHTHIISYYII